MSDQDCPGRKGRKQRVERSTLEARHGGRGCDRASLDQVLLQISPSCAKVLSDRVPDQKDPLLLVAKDDCSVLLLQAGSQVFEQHLPKGFQSDFLKEDHSGWQVGRARGLGDLSGLKARNG